MIIGIMLFGSVHGQINWKAHRSMENIAVQTQLKYMNKYIDYCYADSTIKYAWGNVTWSGGLWDDTIYTMEPIRRMETNSWRCDSVYSHKQPTFEGYVEWMTELLKEWYDINDPR